MLNSIVAFSKSTWTGEVLLNEANKKKSTNRMHLEALNQNIVAIVQEMNPRNYGEHWMIKNDIIKEGELEEPSFFSPVLAHVSTPEVRLLINPERIQANLKDPSSTNLTNKVTMEKFISCAPELNVKAIGVNFLWKISSDKDNNLLRSLLNGMINIQSEILSELNPKESTYGAELYNTVFGVRRRVKISPMFKDEISIDPVEAVIDINYHFSKGTDEDKKDPHEAFKLFTDVRKDAESILKPLQSKVQIK